MIVQCALCRMYFEDVYRTTICPHDTFLANDGFNNFAHHPDSVLQLERPSSEIVRDANRVDDIMIINRRA